MLRRLMTVFAVAAASIAVAAEPNLPKVMILGGEYYYYEIKKGDSLYGVAKQFGWDSDTLRRLNPETSVNMKKGGRLYYPTGSRPQEPVAMTTAAGRGYDDGLIEHVVKKGETVYSISRVYNIPVARIYESHPSARDGIREGEVLKIRPQSSGKEIMYEIKSGDTLYALARTYETSVADILEANPGISENNFQAGAVIKIPRGSNEGRIRKETVTENKVASLDSYKVKRDDTWTSIAKKTGTDVDTLREANAGTKKLNKNDIINVPHVETVEVEKTYMEEDPRDKTPEGRRELYEAVNNIDDGHPAASVAVVLSDPDSKVDSEFAKGFLMGVDMLKNKPFKTTVSILDGSKGSDYIISKLSGQNPGLIVSTSLKSLPSYLIEYGDSTHAEVVNVFDLKDETYMRRPSVIQMLPPSAYFNQAVGDYILSNFSGSQFVFAGDPDSEDVLGAYLRDNMPGSQSVSVEGIADYTLLDDTRYVIYAYPTKRDDVRRLLEGITAIREANPLARVSVIGRPSWVTLPETDTPKLNENEVYIPSRFYFDSTSATGKRFNAEYEDNFGAAPLKSYPGYAAAGYDVASIFLPALAANGGDFNVELSSENSALQTDVNLRRVSNWGGLVNSCCYLVRFTPYGTTERILVK